jgi:hypothetical protein
METYRHATYRYSTGQGFNVNVNVPQKTEEVASYKMEPLYHTLGRPAFTVNLKREADRISMQVEDAFRQMKNLGYDSEAGRRYRNLKLRLEVIKHLFTSYPIEYIRQRDLEKIYKLYAKGSPGMNKMIRQIIEQNKHAGGVHDYIGAAVKVRKGYPLFDQFGRKLTAKQAEMFKKEEKRKGLSGFGEEGKGSLLRLVAIVIIVTAVLKWSSK